MTYRFIYSNFEKERIIYSCIIDKRASIPAIKNQVGSVIKSYVDGVLSEIPENALVYKIETASNGVLAGYVILVPVMERVVNLYGYLLRPAFDQFNSEISSLIATFITSGGWRPDYLN